MAAYTQGRRLSVSSHQDELMQITGQQRAIGQELLGYDFVRLEKCPQRHKRLLSDIFLVFLVSHQNLSVECIKIYVVEYKNSKNSKSTLRIQAPFGG